MDSLDVQIQKRIFRRHVRYALTMHQIWRLKSLGGERPLGRAPPRCPPLQTIDNRTRISPVAVYYNTVSRQQIARFPQGGYSLPLRYAGPWNL